jgi:uncharacterized protein (TIGR02231 family)
MKKIALLYFISFAVFAADDTRVASKIVKVTVFQNQAQITCIAKATINAGNNTIIIENVSPQLDPQSIQIAGKGDIVLLGSKYNNNFSGNTKNSPRMTQLIDSMRFMNEELRMIQFNQESLEREKDLLKVNYSTGATTIANTADKVKAMADFFRLRMADINMNIIKNERNAILMKEKSIRMQSQINELNEKRNTPSGEISLNISANARTATELEITYVVAGAGWSPVYDVRVKDTKSPIKLGYKANVWQQTGLDWNEVKLSLSSANPSQGGNKPELYPQMVDFYQIPRPQQSSMRKGKAMEATEMVLNDAVVAGAPMAQATTSADYTTITENTLAVNFDIALPYTVLNGGSPQLVDIQNYDLTGAFKHFGVPKIDQDAFLTSEITGWEQYNLLPGQANVYFEGAFVGQTYMIDNNVKDTLVLSLGRDKKINLKREVVRDYKSKKAIGTNIKENQAYKITVRNTKKEAINIVLEDQLPVSKNSDIEVLDAEYAGGELNAETGKITWRLNLKPTEVKIIEVKYAVKYPKGKTITGL